MRKWQSLVVGALWALSVCSITLPITGLFVKMATALLGLAYSRAATFEWRRCCGYI